MVRGNAGIVAGCIALALPGLARAQGPIPTPIPRASTLLDLQPIATGLNQPNFLTHAGDASGRSFVLERNGRVRIIDSGGLAPTPFLDMSSRVLIGGERGLLGLAFHPGFANAASPGFGKFYTYSSEAASAAPDYPVPAGGPTDHHSVIAEWNVLAGNPALADPGSRREILRIAQPQPNHNGGALAFSPLDGYLYAALGDGGASNDLAPGHSLPNGNGQDFTNVLGDILRIDPLAPALTPGSLDLISANGAYRIPGSNPFAGAVAGADEIFATGFRNPFRMSFDALDGRLLVGDVGQGNIEEVDIVTLGGNYGWRFKEGTFQFNPANGSVSVGPDPVAGLIDPVLQYDHDEGNSIIGGFVYRGAALPDLFGQYVFGDLSGRLFRGDLTSGQIAELRLGMDAHGVGSAIIGFGEDAARELYVLTTNFSPTGGTVQRIVPLATDVPEPGSLLLAAGALGAFAVPGLRRRSAKRPPTS